MHINTQMHKETFLMDRVAQSKHLETTELDHDVSKAHVKNLTSDVTFFHIKKSSPHRV